MELNKVEFTFFQLLLISALVFFDFNIIQNVCFLIVLAYCAKFRIRDYGSESLKVLIPFYLNIKSREEEWTEVDDDFSSAFAIIYHIGFMFIFTVGHIIAYFIN